MQGSSHISPAHCGSQLHLLGFELLQLPWPEQSGFPGQSGVLQSSPAHPCAHIHFLEFVSQKPWSGLVHCPGHPGSSQYSPIAAAPGSWPQLHLLLMHSPNPEHSLWHPLPVKQGSQTHIPSLGWPCTQGSLQAGPIQPWIQSVHSGVTRLVVLQWPRPKQFGIPGQSGMWHPTPVQPKK